jgi:hypothetical protein
MNTMRSLCERAAPIPEAARLDLARTPPLAFSAKRDRIAKREGLGIPRKHAVN